MSRAAGGQAGGWAAGLQRHLRSTRHLVGTLLAVAGLLAHFAGLLEAFWLPIVLGLYALGVLVTPQTQADLQLEELAGQQALRGELQTFLRGLHGRVAPDVQVRLARLEAQLDDLLPRLRELELQGNPHAFTIRQIVTDYLPETFENYLRLPPRYAQQHVLPGGRTPHAVLLDQLALLEQTLESITVSVAQGDTGELLANGRFLQDKFGTPDLKL